jgi:hypothetical protein
MAWHSLDETTWLQLKLRRRRCISGLGIRCDSHALCGIHMRSDWGQSATADDAHAAMRANTMLSYHIFDGAQHVINLHTSALQLPVSTL